MLRPLYCFPLTLLAFTLPGMLALSLLLVVEGVAALFQHGLGSWCPTSAVLTAYHGWPLTPLRS